MAESVALKVASDDDKKSQLIEEVQFLMNLHHEGIVCSHGIYAMKVQGKTSMGLLLDYKEGGDLQSRIPTDGFSERIVRGITVQICDALVYLHGIPAVHRDIKPSNVLCERAEDGSVKVVLADFGFAAHVSDRNRLSIRCGTGGYIAPEMLKSDWANTGSDESAYDITKLDVFSFGMLIYQSAFGTNPLKGESLLSTYRRNARGLVCLWNMAGRSDDLQALLSGLCATNPHERFSSSEVLTHPWFSSDDGVSRSNGASKYAKVAWDAFEFEGAHASSARVRTTRPD